MIHGEKTSEAAEPKAAERYVFITHLPLSFSEGDCKTAGNTECGGADEEYYEPVACGDALTPFVIDAAVPGKMVKERNRLDLEKIQRRRLNAAAKIAVLHLVDLPCRVEQDGPSPRVFFRRAVCFLRQGSR